MMGSLSHCHYLGTINGDVKKLLFWRCSLSTSVLGVQVNATKYLIDRLGGWRWAVSHFLVTPYELRSWWSYCWIAFCLWTFVSSATVEPTLPVPRSGHQHHQHHHREGVLQCHRVMHRDQPRSGGWEISRGKGELHLTSYLVSFTDFVAVEIRELELPLLTPWPWCHINY